MSLMFYRYPVDWAENLTDWFRGCLPLLRLSCLFSSSFDSGYSGRIRSRTAHLMRRAMTLIKRYIINIYIYIYIYIYYYVALSVRALPFLSASATEKVKLRINIRNAISLAFQ